MTSFQRAYYATSQLDRGMTKPTWFPFTYIFDLLNSPRVKPLAQRLHPSTVVEILKGVFDDARQELRYAVNSQRLPDVNELLEKVVARLDAALDSEEALAIDARGRIVPDDLERLADVALQERVWLAAEPDSPYSRRQDVRRERDALARLVRLTGAESAAIFPNTELARLALLHAYATSGGNFVVARRDMCEREDGARLEDVFAAFPQFTRREVGACNAIDARDYDRALDAETRLVWRAIGRWSVDARTVADSDLLKLKDGADRSFAVVADLEFAPLLDLSEYFYSSIPTIGEQLKSGFDFVVCDGAQLIGGPHCGLLFGSRDNVSRICATPFARVAPVDRVTIGALAKTLALYDDPSAALATIPVLRTLSTSVDNLESRASRLAAMASTFAGVDYARVVSGRSLLCGAANMPTSPTRLVELSFKGHSSAELAEALERGTPKLLVKWTRDSILVDLKTVPAELDLAVAEIFERVSERGAELRESSSSGAE